MKKSALFQITIIVTALISTVQSQQLTSSINNSNLLKWNNPQNSPYNADGELWMIGWLKHWTISFGTTINSDMHIIATNYENSTSFEDGYNDHYDFQWSIKEFNGSPAQSHFSLRIPLYFKNNQSTGLFFYRRGFGAELLAGENYTSKPKNQNLGIFYTRYITPKLRTTFSIGTSNYELGATIGSLKPAWSGDPGFYYEKEEKFIDIDTDMFLSGFSESYTSYMVEVAYMIWRGFFVELHFSTHEKDGIISQFDYQMGDYNDFGTVVLENPVTFKDSNVFSISIGLGY